MAADINSGTFCGKHYCLQGCQDPETVSPGSYPHDMGGISFLTACNWNVYILVNELFNPEAGFQLDETNETGADTL